MRRHLAALCLVVLGGVGLLFAPPSASPARLGPVAAECGAGYVSAHLSWGNKCLRAGEFCKVGNAQYGAYGFTCPASGHLTSSASGYTLAQLECSAAAEVVTYGSNIARANVGIISPQDLVTARKTLQSRVCRALGYSAPAAPRTATPRPTPPPVTSTTTPTTPSSPTTKTCANPQTTNVDVNMFDFGFTITPSTAPCGRLNITERNTGMTYHNFDINGQAAAIIAAGQSSTFAANLLPGSQTYQCDVPGHVGLGMGGAMTITG